MPKIMINMPDGLTTREEEIAVLKKLVENVGSKSYLSSLLHPKLLEYFENTIRNDFLPNIAEQYYLAIEAQAKGEGDANIAKNELKTATTEFNRSKEKFEEDKGVLEAKLEIEHGRWGEALKESKKNWDSYIEQRTLAGEWINKAKDKDKEITRLKALLFDLQAEVADLKSKPA